MKDIIEDALCLYEEGMIDEDDDPIFEDISDLQQSGYMTGDEGLVVTMADGRKFIIRVQEV